MQAETISKHDAVYQALEQRIVDGQWKVGDQMPTEMELATAFNCSRSTMGKALARLVHEGFVARKPRLGTRVIRQSRARTKVVSDLNAYAFIFPSQQHEGVWRTVQGFQAAAQKTNRRVLMLSTDADYGKETEFITRLTEFDVRAGVIFPVLQTPKDVVHFSNMIVASTLPLVLTEMALPGTGCPAVVVDDFHAGYTMTRHLIDRGATRIGYFSNYAWASFMRDRFKGYSWAMEEAALEVPAAAVMMEPGMHPDFDNPLAEPVQLAEKFLANAGRIDAVVCSDDYLALGCLAAANVLGLKVPRDLLITGIDDYRIASDASVPLTTYHVPYEEIGRKAFETLDALSVHGPGISLEIQVRGTLVIRETT
jgi:DNA-binding LacI/PurR family transcriptional regulator